MCAFRLAVPTRCLLLLTTHYFTTSTTSLLHTILCLTLSIAPEFTSDIVVEARCKPKMLFGSSNISLHMKQKLLAILPKLGGARHTKTPGGLDKIDLSVAENLLLRDELLAFCKDTIAEDLKPEVSPESIRRRID
jgi:hypothetical protein